MIRQDLSVYIRGRFRYVFWALAWSNLLSVGFFAARVSAAGNLRYWFLVWNLLLGWLPLLFAGLLTARLRGQSWLTPANLLLGGLWLVFLPNSFYLISDLIHLHPSGEVSVLFDAALMFSFIFNALVLGYMSIFLIHSLLLKRLRRRDAHGLIGVVFLLCGLAVYLGRYLRWNTWDILINPAGLLFDLSEGVINPTAHPQAFTTTLTFTLLLSAMYAVIWHLTVALSTPAKQK